MSGSGGGGGGGGGGGEIGSTGTAGSVSGSGSGFGSGGEAQAASSASARQQKVARRLVTEPDSKNVDLGFTQTTTQHVQLVEVLSRADVHAMIIAVVNLDALRYRLNAV